MTREQQLQRYVFESKRSLNGQVPLRPETVLDGLAHALTSRNAALVGEATKMLNEQVTIRRESR